MIRYLVLGAGALIAAVPALAQDGAQAGGAPDRHVVVAPYIEASQTLDADLRGGDVLTYTSLAAGVDAAVTTARTDGQASLRYEHRFAYDRYDGDQDIASGLVRASYRASPDLRFDVGGLATRTREDIRGAAPGLLTGNDPNITQVYSVYGGPTLATHAGDVSLGATYQAGYTKVKAPGATDALGSGRLDYFDHSFGQAAAASAGIAAGTVLPIGLSINGGWQQERASQLSQHLDDYYGRGDVLIPVLPTLALAGGVGYEKLTVSQKDPVYGADGTPLVDGNGRFVTNDASPRRIAYRTDGVYWDAGVVWKPNHGTSLSAYVGHRYDSMSYTGQLTYQASRSVGVTVNVYDQVTTFGQQLRDGLASLPTSFIAARDAFSQQYNGCVFSSSGTTPGGCLDSVFQSITTASYRARGVDGAISVNRGLTTYGVGFGYENRKLFAPNVPLGALAFGNEDQSAYGQIFWSRQLSRVSGVQANLFADWYRPGGDPIDVWSYGATASYYHNFGRLGTTASVGIYDFKQGDVRSQIAANATLAARYTF